ncbi:hypothetical protein SUSAZ_08605 [Sulfolobus acidocaldarius SUSAZ]|nr:hypothetical protein SUSAZ_08605 [Sulfolobus acidocaldarius SUSAZ]
MKFVDRFMIIFKQIFVFFINIIYKQESSIYTGKINE